MADLSSRRFQISLSGLLLSAGVPPAQDCAGKPCWRASRNGFLYRDRVGDAAQGLYALRLRAIGGESAKMSFKARR